MCHYLIVREKMGGRSDVNGHGGGGGQKERIGDMEKMRREAEETIEQEEGLDEGRRRRRMAPKRYWSVNPCSIGQSRTRRTHSPRSRS